MHNPLKNLTILCMLAALCGCDSSNGSDRDGGGDPPGDASIGGDGAPVAHCDGTADGTCPCVVYEHGGSRYLRCPDTTTWQEAHDDCTRFGYELVHIDDQAEQDYIWTTVAGEVGDYWIGLNDRGTEGEYVWSDGETSDYVTWGPAEPDNGNGEGEEDCIEIQEVAEGSWNDLDCSIDFLDYICEGPL
jgi:hypothetical protein